MSLHPTHTSAPNTQPELLKAKGAGEPSADMPAATTVVLVIGDPASGKTTMCRKLAERNAYAHFVPGDLLREEVEQGTVTGAVRVRHWRSTGCFWGVV